MPEIILQCRGKINLFLEVRNRRRDGFTNIETVFQSVDVFDDLHMVSTDGEIELTCDHPAVPTDERNLVVQAASLLRERYGPANGARVHLTKRLPVAGGMAGGSTDAAGALEGLSRLWSLDLPRRALFALALELGSDVPFCMLGGTAFASGRGERIEALPPPPQAGVVLVHPSFEVSAREAYGSGTLTRSVERPFSGRTRSARQAWRALRQGDWRRGVHNRLETGVFPQYPELAEVKARLLERGCVAAALSGSGATVFGICESEREACRIADEWTECPARATRLWRP